ncbi:MAG: hypothetical protein A2V70_12470 [Planctomycetes bacterium RBG_13_63_9]|nr:MAG: hypothetical protein A2V70_12470 [Planctomycetes bacterium RBG_13_63_9]
MPAETTQIPDAGMAAEPRGGLRSRSFTGLLVTQFLGAVNDNMFRWLVVPLGKDIVGQEHAAVALSVGLACFVVPYLMLAAPAGYLADRFSKRTVIVGCKVGELVIAILGVASLFVGSLAPGLALYLMFAVIALMGAQSALFGPSKFGSIPEMVRSDRISAANGLIGMTTVVAIVAGTIAGNCLYGLTKALGVGGMWLSAAALVGVAVIGLLASLMIAPLRSANPSRRFPINAPRQTVRDLALLASRRPLLRAALGCTVFMCLGALAQMNVDLFVITELGAGQAHVGVLLALLVVGVGTGSILAGVWSGGRVELGIVPLGAAGIAISAVLLSVAPAASDEVLSAAYYWSCFWLLMLGVGAGLYNIPILAFLQRHSPPHQRGSILAASNFLTFLGILLASGLFWLWRSVLDLSARDIFLLLGMATVPVLLYVVWLLPGATARFVVWLLSHTIYRVRLEGRENLPADGGALVVANHASFIDGVLLILFFPREIRMVARADADQRWWFRWLAKDLGTIFIEPGKRSVVESIRNVREALSRGDAVCVFPEGRITRSGELGEFRRGFLAMLKGTDVPVVPIFLAGLWGSIFSYEGGKALWKRPRRWPYPVSILIGRPIPDPTDTEQARSAIAGLEAGWRNA